jgi:hypothetical protein
VTGPGGLFVLLAEIHRPISLISEKRNSCKDRLQTVAVILKANSTKKSLVLSPLALLTALFLIGLTALALSLVVLVLSGVRERLSRAQQTVELVARTWSSFSLASNLLVSQIVSSVIGQHGVHARQHAKLTELTVVVCLSRLVSAKFWFRVMVLIAMAELRSPRLNHATPCHVLFTVSCPTGVIGLPSHAEW